MRQTRTAIMLGSTRRFALACTLQFWLGCSFDDHPSLGRQAADSAPGEHTAVNQVPPANDVASVTEVGSATAGASPNTSLAPETMIAPRDAGMARDAAFAAADSDASDPSDTGTVNDPKGNRSCVAGTYAGDFTCLVDPTGVTPLTSMPHATFSLQQTSAGTALAVGNADFAFDLVGFVFEADLAGTLDCTTGSFHAEFVNGHFTPVILPIPAPFTGSIDGQLDSATHTLTGAWSFTTATGSTCTGQWTASLQP